MTEQDKDARIEQLEGDVERLRQQNEYLTGVPSHPATMNDYRADELDVAIMALRDTGRDAEAQTVNRFRLEFRRTRDETDRLRGELLALTPSPAPTSVGSDAQVERMRVALAAFVASLTNGGRNRRNTLSIDHEALTALVLRAISALTPSPAPTSGEASESLVPSQ